MNRRSSILIALVAVGALAAVQSGCNEPSCGPGTVQQQQKDGTLKCVQTDDLNSMTPCEVDGGNVMIVGGKCVSAVQCDPASTIEINGVCVGIGNSGATCRTPAPGKACVSGSIIDFKTNVKASTPIHVELYDPIAVLTPGATPIAMYDSADGGSYVFQDFQVPSLGIIVVTTGKGTAGFIVAGSAAQGIASGNQYKLDTYSIPKADSDAVGLRHHDGRRADRQVLQRPQAAADQHHRQRDDAGRRRDPAQRQHDRCGCRLFQRHIDRGRRCADRHRRLGHRHRLVAAHRRRLVPDVQRIGPDSDADHLGGVARRLGAGPGPDHAFPPEHVTRRPMANATGGLLDNA